MLKYSERWFARSRTITPLINIYTQASNNLSSNWPIDNTLDGRDILDFKIDEALCVEDDYTIGNFISNTIDLTVRNSEYSNIIYEEESRKFNQGIYTNTEKSAINNSITLSKATKFSILEENFNSTTTHNIDFTGDWIRKNGRFESKPYQGDGISEDPPSYSSMAECVVMAGENARISYDRSTVDGQSNFQTNNVFYFYIDGYPVEKIPSDPGIIHKIWNLDPGPHTISFRFLNENNYYDCPDYVSIDNLEFYDVQVDDVWETDGTYISEAIDISDITTTETKFLTSETIPDNTTLDITYSVDQNTWYPLYFDYELNTRITNADTLYIKAIFHSDEAGITPILREINLYNKIDARVLPSEFLGSHISIDMTILESGTDPEETVELGHFVITESKKNNKNKTIELKGVDLFTYRWNKKIFIREGNTIQEVLTNLCGSINIDFAGVNTNSKEIISLACKDLNIEHTTKTGVYIVEALKDLAKITGCNAIMNRQGKMEFRYPYDIGACNPISGSYDLAHSIFLTNNNYFNTNILETNSLPIGSVTVSGGETNIAIIGTPTTSNRSFAINDNTFLYGPYIDIPTEDSYQSPQIVAQSIFDMYDDYSYRPFTMKAQSNPTIETGAIVIVYDNNYNTETSFIESLTMKYGGGFKVEYNTKGSSGLNDFNYEGISTSPTNSVRILSNAIGGPTLKAEKSDFDDFKSQTELDLLNPEYQKIKISEKNNTQYSGDVSIPNTLAFTKYGMYYTDQDTSIPIYTDKYYLYKKYYLNYKTFKDINIKATLNIIGETSTSTEWKVSMLIPTNSQFRGVADYDLDCIPTFTNLTTSRFVKITGHNIVTSPDSDRPRSIAFHDYKLGADVIVPAVKIDIIFTGYLLKEIHDTPNDIYTLGRYGSLSGINLSDSIYDLDFRLLIEFNA